MRRYLTKKESAQLLRPAELRARAGEPVAERDAAVMLFLQFSGMRVGEFLASNLAQARHAIDLGYFVILKEARKGKARAHPVFMTQPARQALARLVKVRDCFGGDGGDDAPLILNQYGARLSVRGLEARVAYWTTVAGLPLKVSPHWFRHTRAVSLVQASEAANPLKVVQEVLGHADIRSAGIYTDVLREDVERAMQRADAGRSTARKRDQVKLFQRGNRS